MSSKQILIVETVRGQIEANKLLTEGICLFHERLSPLVYQISCDRSMSIENIQYHRYNLLSLENTALTPGMIDHEVQVLLQRINKTPSEVIVLDGSNYDTKVPEIMEKYLIVKGYQYRITGNPPQSQKVVLLSKEHISKQLQYQFKLGNGKFKPGFIGQLYINECLEGNDYFNAYKVYLQFSANNNCLIIINSLELGQKVVHQSLKIQTHSQYQHVYQLFKKISFALRASQDLNAKRVVLYNIPFIFQTVIDQNFTQITTNIVNQLILNLFNQYQCFFGFDLSRYSHSKQALYYIGQLVANFPNRMVLSGGLTYKTDLTTYAGNGYLYYKGEKLTQMTLIAGEKNIKSALFDNKLNLLTWKTKQQEIKVVIIWKCNECGREQPETVQSFRKFGKQFCSIKCLKSHKF